VRISTQRCGKQRVSIFRVPGKEKGEAFGLRLFRCAPTYTGLFFACSLALCPLLISQNTQLPQSFPPHYSHFVKFEVSSNMPELRGVQATPEVKEEGGRAYELFTQAPGDAHDERKDRAKRFEYVARELNLTHKQAKRRIRNYEAWQHNLKQGMLTS
jgi:hypothetical protein